uniref:Uncharacterized protein n=1 Tax=Ditylum brightwellii TaxID=49249 RepID=A0A7S4RYR8_9STRA
MHQIILAQRGNDYVNAPFDSRHLETCEAVQLGQDLDGEAAGDYFGYRFGWSVALSSDGNTFAVGGILNDGNGRLLLWGEFSMMEMVLMQAMHVYSIGMEMPGHRGGMTWMEKTAHDW